MNTKDLIYKNIDKRCAMSHTITHNPINSVKNEFHLHNTYEIYYLINGDVNYFVEKTSYKLEPGDVLVFNTNEVHKASFYSNHVYERVVMNIDCSWLKDISTDQFNLTDCFEKREQGKSNRLPLDSKQKEVLHTIIKKLIKLNPSNEEYSLLKYVYFVEAMVFLNKAFKQVQSFYQHNTLPKKLYPIISYIDNNINKDLSLEILEKNFFINRYYLSRLFKKSIGCTLHDYILYKRISLAKRLINDGYSATQSCIKSGFNDYSNFVKMFKRTVGVTPGAFKKQHK